MPINRRVFALFGIVVQVGLLMATSIFLGYRAGVWLDQLLERTVLFSVVGALLGIGAGFYTVYRLLMGVVNRDDLWLNG